MPTKSKKLVPFSFEKYYTRYFPILFRFALKYTSLEALSKDLAQNTLIKFWKHWDRNTQEKRAIEAFLFKTIKNEIIDHFRKIKVRQNFVLNFKRNVTFEETSNLFEIEERIKKTYKRLPDKTRIIFQLSRIEGLSYQEIATQLNVSKKTVEYHISNALRCFRGEFYGKV